jgi:hypothetical protein
MGLLDDAIREHLELKRRRGADPDEVARQEDEALGDPRRGEFAQPDAPAAVPLGDAEAAPPEPADAPAPEPEAAPPEPPAPRDEPWLEEEPVAPPPPPAPAAEPVAEEVGQPTAEFAPFDVERHEPEAPREPAADVVRPDEEPAADEDVLEETPDFLQETPEHDRLWFEQKPPRGFDFDR